ncbi:sulfur-oxidizing protein SoxX [Polynucleobacter meluiroseus]|uniref:Sulfur-oxidizing protein SoxX n=1 Tax=Polynucleobacter meluiroseus TaxID=1938814 RepID=A0A240E1Q6_9BURK|nr:sulfur oxidation c-type cytochrome SoxX [Polynucleobacter meluiroseus]SNX29369.1 sulfur-oxidizing protein SoxX [Polynucleobacter meluiroseus]
MVLMRLGSGLAAVLLAILLVHVSAVSAQTVVGDSIAESLSHSAGDPLRGRAIIVNRQQGLCLLCHNGPFPEERFQGNLAPELGVSVGSLSAGQLRARLVDPKHFHPDTIMPSFYRTEGLTRVAAKFSGKPILSAQEIEDVIAFLLTMNQTNSSAAVITTTAP